MSYDVIALQRALKKLGFYQGRIDGIVGPKTEKAISDFKASVGLMARAYVGPITIQKLKEASGIDASLQAPEGPVILPWINEINKVWGLHEVHNNKALTRWLRSDGSLLGDPAALPWCGDAVETAVKRTLPNEVLPDRLAENPFWARNWALFGVYAPSMPYGAVISVKRGSGGHVGFLVGISEDRTLFRVRGGNQSNMINDTWLSASRLLDRGVRWPASYPTRFQVPAPTLNAHGAVISTNEY